MKEENNIPNHDNECISSDALLKYIKGELSGLERNRIERHISSCEMCSDEVEGLLCMENPQKIIEISHELNQKIDSLSAKPEREIPYLGLYIKIAASIILLLGVSTVIYFTAFRKAPVLLPSYALMEAAQEVAPPPPPQEAYNDSLFDSGTTDNKKAEKLESEVNSKVKERVLTKKLIAKSEETVKYVAPVVVDSAVLNDEVVEAKDEELAKSIVVEESKEAEVSQITAESNIKAAPVSVDKRSAMGEIVNRKMLSGAAASKESINRATYNTRKETAIQLYSKRKYENALVILSMINQDFPNKDTIVFYASLCNFQLNRFSETISQIEVIAKNPQSAFYSQAKWYFALALIGADRKDDAKIILEQILKDNSPYRSKAKKELEKLSGIE